MTSDHNIMLMVEGMKMEKTNGTVVKDYVSQFPNIKQLWMVEGDCFLIGKQKKIQSCQSL